MGIRINISCAGISISGARGLSAGVSRPLALLLVLGLLVGGPVSAQELDAAVASTVNSVLADILDLRHRIHQFPELGNREVKTAGLVEQHLRSLGFDEVRTGIAYTGVVGVLTGKGPGAVVAVRADMGALPVTEDTDYPFKSEVRTEYLGQEVGVMHACGHDVHTAVQLGVASVLAAHRDQWSGTVLFIFQPAEEGAPPGEQGGAKLMMDEGVLNDPKPQAIFGLHTFSSLDVGQLGYTSGPAFASVDHFKIDIHGKQAHGAQPHTSIDPVVMSAQVISALQTIRSRNLSPLEPSVVTVGIVRGGTRYNIIPASVHLEGTVRTYNNEVLDTIERRMGEILAGITQAAGGSFDLQYDRNVPPTLNDPALTAQTVPSLQAVVGEQNVQELDPTMGGEDFAYFAEAVPGFYFRLGSRHPEKGSGGHHTPTFAADDGSVEVGIRAMTRVLLDYLERSN